MVTRRQPGDEEKRPEEDAAITVEITGDVHGDVTVAGRDALEDADDDVE